MSAGTSMHTNAHSPSNALMIQLAQERYSAAVLFHHVKVLLGEFYIVVVDRDRNGLSISRSFFALLLRFGGRLLPDGLGVP